MKSKIFSLFAGLLILATFIAAPVRAQTVPPAGTKVVSLTVTTNATVALRFYTPSTITIWIEAEPGVYTEQTLPGNPAAFSPVANFTAVGTVLKIHGDFIGFNCKDNTTKITGIDVTGNSYLTSLTFDNNQVSEIDLSQNTNLQKLYCTQNVLTTLDLSHNSLLEQLFCQQNQLTALNLTGSTKLTACAFNQNKLGACALNDIYIALPPVAAETVLHNWGNPGASTSNTSIAEGKNWKPNAVGDGSAICIPTGIEKSLQDVGVKAWSLDGNLLLETSTLTKSANVFNISGQLIRSIKLDRNQIRIPLSAGVYIIKVDEITQKVIVK